MVSHDQKSGDPKSFEGQPWSAWTAYLGIDKPSYDESASGSQASSLKKSTKSTNCVLLKAEDMGIYGRYPGAEPFTLARCKYCGEKFKIAAISEHIVLRHSDGKKQTVSDHYLKNEVKSDKLPKSKSKHKRDIHSPSHSPVKSKFPKILSEELKKPVTASAIKESTSSDSVFVHPSAIPSLNSSKSLPVIMKNETQKSKNELSKVKRIKVDKEERSVTMEKTNSLKSPSAKIISAASPVIQSVTTPSSKSKEKKTEMKKINVLPSQSFKSCDINIKPVDNDCPPKEEVKTVLQPPIEPVQEVPDVKKYSIKEKKTVFTKDRIYNPDRHCGVVIGKENAKPCTRSLTCKTHSMSLRRAVRGRSKTFDVLLANHRAERETSKQKLLVDCHNKKEVNSTANITTAKIPFAPTPTNNVIECEQLMNVPSPVSQVLSITKTDDGFPPRLSLPVSIKNPSLLSVIKSNEFVKPEIIPLKKPKLNGLNMNWDLTSDIVNNLSKRVYQAPFSTRTVLKQMTIKKKKKKLKKKESNLKHQVVGYTQWNPWYRKAGGLLTTSFSMINISAYHRAIASRNYFIKDKVKYESNGFPKYNLSSNSRPKIINFKSNSLSVKDFKDFYFKRIPDTRCTQSTKIISEHFGLWFPTSFILNSQKTFGAQFLIQKKIEKLNLPRKVFRVDDSDNSSSCSDESDNYYRDDLVDDNVQFSMKQKPYLQHN